MVEAILRKIKEGKPNLVKPATSGLCKSPADDLAFDVKYRICETYEDYLYSQSISEEESKKLLK